MADTLTTINAALKEVWPYDRIEKQFYDENKTLDTIQKLKPKVMIGEAAIVPVEVSRPGGYSVLPDAGGSLNPADQLHLVQASYSLTHHHHPIQVGENAIVQSADKASSVAQVLDLQIKGAISSIKKNLSRQAFANGDALLSVCGTTTASTTVTLGTEEGQSALERGLLYPGLSIDIGTTADEDAVAGDRLITSVSVPTGTPSIVISGGAVTTSSSHYVSIANARAGTTSYEMNGFKNLTAASGSFGGVSASTYPNWAGSVDSTSTAISTDALLVLQRNVLQATGEYVDWAVFPPKQLDRFYVELQQQVRFSDDAVKSGGIQASQWNGMTLVPEPDCPRSNVFLIKKDHVFLLDNGDPKWQNTHTGGQILAWLPGTDQYVGKLSKHCQLATNRRNAHAALTALTA